MRTLDPSTPRLLLQAQDAARAAAVSPSAIARAAREGRLRVVARTRCGMRLYAAEDVEAFRRARIARLARQLRAAVEPRDGDFFDAAVSSALDLAIDVEERLEDSDRRR